MSDMCMGGGEQELAWWKGSAGGSLEAGCGRFVSYRPQIAIHTVKAGSEMTSNISFLFLLSFIFCEFAQ
jgi:hypothetical protein